VRKKGLPRAHIRGGRGFRFLCRSRIHSDILECVCELTPAHFYKTMPSEKPGGAFQDVYKTHWCGKPIYTKLNLSPPANKAVVISFTLDESDSPPEKRN